MLIYLFFIFTCGWCVCWLLFLNYQQHAKDSLDERAREQELKQEHNCSKHQIEHQILDRDHCLRRLRRRLFPFSAAGPEKSCLLDDHEYDQAPEVGCQSLDLEAAAAFNKLETVVNEDGDHSLVSVGCDYIELNANCYQDDEPCLPLLPMNTTDYDEQVAGSDQYGLFSLGAASRCHLCESCARSSMMLATGLDLSGAPDEMIERDSVVSAAPQARLRLSGHRWNCARLTVNMAAATEAPELYGPDEGLDEDEQEDEEFTLWPIVELHENPLNVGELPNPIMNASSAEQLEQSQPEELLERSRLLSLQADQVEKRAAIRMVSKPVRGLKGLSSVIAETWPEESIVCVFVSSH